MLLETLRCENGVCRHIAYHQKRVERSLQAIGADLAYPLAALITPPDKGVYRCRFLYDAHRFEIEFHPYTPRKISSLRLITCDDIDYPLKSADRSRLNELYERRGMCDDVLIVRNGLLTDTTIANIAVYDGIRWLTPETPLLKGTTRERLIEEGFLIPAPLRAEEICKWGRIAVMNAMTGFVEVENGIISEE